MNLTAVVSDAKGGDPDAFGALVQEFQDTVVGIAYGWLGEYQRALDVGQEAFADAFRLIGQLEDPSAFPGWLRSIVLKHCDRVTRRRSLATSQLEDAADLRDPQPLPDAVVVHEADRRAVRGAVESLPREQRSVVALYYLAQLKQPAIAALLELPLSTVEHRLRSARRCLRRELENMPERTLGGLRPSKDMRFTDTVRLFLAVRAGDSETVQRLVRRRPELLEAEEDWDRSLAEEGVVPFPARGTPLIRAVERGDERMVRTLLDLGALPDGTCGCETGESAVWTAVQFGYPGLAAELLRRGAAADVASSAGITALHLAAMRGDRETVALLHAHGADPDRMDQCGRRPGDWAVMKGHEELARQLGATGAVSASAPSVVEADVLETGIKAVDLFVPLPRGGVVRQTPGFGSGHVVLLLEITLRLVGRPGTSVVWCGFEQRPFDRRDISAELREVGLGDRVPVVLIGDDSGEALANTVELVRRRAADGEDIMLVVLEETGHTAAVDAILPAFGVVGTGSVTGIVAGPLVGGDSGDGVVLPPYRGHIGFDRSRADRGLYPAVSHRSESDLSDETADRARSLLESDPTGRRAELLSAYLSQPFEVAEPFTCVPGVWVPREQTLRDVATILDGGADDNEPVELLYRGALTS